MAVGIYFYCSDNYQTIIFEVVCQTLRTKKNTTFV